MLWSHILANFMHLVSFIALKAQMKGQPRRQGRSISENFDHFDEIDRTETFPLRAFGEFDFLCSQISIERYNRLGEIETEKYFFTN